MSEAVNYLVEPAEPDDSITNGFVNPVDIFNYLSPSAWVNSLIADITGFDPFAYCTETFTGEWDKLYQWGDAVGNLGTCLQQIGFNIQEAAVKVDAEWDGRANDAAVVYFSNLAATLSRQKAVLDECMKGYHQAAKGAWELSSQAGNVLQVLADKAILFGLSVAIGSATAETGVGAVLGYGMAAYQAVEILELANRASVIANTAGSVIFGLFGTGMLISGEGGDLTAVPLPADGFAVPKAAS